MVVPRITRELVAVMMSDSESTTFSRPGPSTAMTESTMIRYGNESQASTTRWTTRS